MNFLKHEHQQLYEDFQPTGAALLQSDILLHNMSRPTAKHLFLTRSLTSRKRETWLGRRSNIHQNVQVALYWALTGRTGEGGRVSRTEGGGAFVKEQNLVHQPWHWRDKSSSCYLTKWRSYLRTKQADGLEWWSIPEKVIRVRASSMHQYWPVGPGRQSDSRSLSELSSLHPSDQLGGSFR